MEDVWLTQIIHAQGAWKGDEEQLRAIAADVLHLHGSVVTGLAALKRSLKGTLEPTKDDVATDSVYIAKVGGCMHGFLDS